MALNISYGILSHNRGEKIKVLIDLILKFIESGDEIVIIDDYSNNETIEILKSYSKYSYVRVYYRYMEKYCDQRNILNKLCFNDFIFCIDDDELPTQYLLSNIKNILLENNVDVIFVPRINIVEQIRLEHLERWNWKINENNWINFPDYQGRIYKNKDNILWENHPHEILRYKSKTLLPLEEKFSLWHVKDIAEQVEQNNRYEQILSKSAQ